MDKNNAITENEAAYRLTHDEVTDLPNRVLFSDRAAMALASAHRNRERLAVMLVDLDNFKDIIDAYGPSEGDTLLKAAGDRIAKRLRKGDTLARIGGDTFALILPGVTRKENAGVVARQILEAFQTPFSVLNDELRITTSIGISILPEDGDTEEELIKTAGIALKRAQDRGRSNYQYYTPII